MKSHPSFENEIRREKKDKNQKLDIHICGAFICWKDFGSCDLRTVHVCFC